MAEIQLRPITKSDRDWLKRLVRLHFGSEKIIVHDTFFSPAREEGLVAFIAQKRVGVVSLVQAGETCEIILLDALQSREDIFKSLLSGAEKWAREHGCSRLIVTTTNDNTDALCMYKKNGFSLTDLRVDAVTESRKKKPEIPQTGDEGIPIRDELELELRL